MLIQPPTVMLSPQKAVLSPLFTTISTAQVCTNTVAKNAMIPVRQTIM